MELSERRINLLEKKIADLEVQVQNQQESKIDVDEVIDRLQVALSKQI